MLCPCAAEEEPRLTDFPDRPAAIVLVQFHQGLALRDGYLCVVDHGFTVLMAALIFTTSSFSSTKVFRSCSIFWQA